MKNPLFRGDFHTKTSIYMGFPRVSQLATSDYRRESWVWSLLSTLQTLASQISNSSHPELGTLKARDLTIWTIKKWCGTPHAIFGHISSWFLSFESWEHINWSGVSPFLAWQIQIAYRWHICPNNYQFLNSCGPVEPQRWGFPKMMFLLAVVHWRLGMNMTRLHGQWPRGSCYSMPERVMLYVCTSSGPPGTVDGQAILHQLVTIW